MKCSLYIIFICASNWLMAQDSLLLKYEEYLQSDRDYQTGQQLANSLGREGYYKESITLYRSILEDSPKDVDLLLGLGLVLGWSGDYRPAISILNEAAELAPEYADVWAAISRINFWDNNLDDALIAVDTWSQLMPSDPEGFLLKGKILAQLRKFGLARQAFTAAQRLGADRDSVRRLLSSMAMDSEGVKWEYRGGGSYQTIDNGGDPWSAAELGIIYRNIQGSVYTGVRYVNRFGLSAAALDLDGYLTLQRGRYVNVRVAIAPKAQVLPNYDFTAEGFLPIWKNSEISASFRHMSFPNDEVNIYGISIGKYTRNYFFRGSSLITPEDALKLYVNILVRRYLVVADHFIEIRYGTGYAIDQAENGSLPIIARSLGLKGQWYPFKSVGFLATVDTFRTSRYNRGGAALMAVVRF